MYTPALKSKTPNTSVNMGKIIIFSDEPAKSTIGEDESKFLMATSLSTTNAKIRLYKISNNINIGIHKKEMMIILVHILIFY